MKIIYSYIFFTILVDVKYTKLILIIGAGFQICTVRGVLKNRNVFISELFYTKYSEFIERERERERGRLVNVS